MIACNGKHLFSFAESSLTPNLAALYTSLMQHLAIVKPEVVVAILSGEKTCESRLSRVPGPVRRVEPGDEILFKATRGDVEICAQVERVEHYADLRPADIGALRELYGQNVAVPGMNMEAYWSGKINARYASFIWLCELCALHIPRATLPRSYGSAWFADWPSP